MPVQRTDCCWFRRFTALVCLFAFLTVGVVHGAHLCSARVVDQRTSLSSGDGSDGPTFCLACVAAHSSVTTPVFLAVAPAVSVHTSGIVSSDDPRSPVRFFRLFVRPPPAA